MSNELKPLALDPDMQRGLPLGYRRIMVSDDILDERATRILTLELAKFRHVTTFVRRSNKPISKPEL